MFYEEAKDWLRKGKSVRRECWDTSLTRKNGPIEWDISDELALSCGNSRKPNKKYTPHVTDLVAFDWVAF